MKNYRTGPTRRMMAAFTRAVASMALGATALTGSPTAAQADLNAHWTFDNTTADSSGNGNTLVLENGAGFAPGKFNEALSLNGSNQYALDPTPSFGLTNGDFTVSVWANAATFSTAPTGLLPNTFIGQDNGGGLQPKWVVYYDRNNNALGFHSNGGNGSQFAEGALPSTPQAGQWNMYTVTGDIAAHTVSFYYDGQFVSTVGGVPWNYPTAGITIGEAEGIGWFNGLIDDTRVYNSALTVTQIQTLYNAPVPEASSIAGFGTLLLLSGLGVARTRRRSKPLQAVSSSDTYRRRLT